MVRIGEITTETLMDIIHQKILLAEYSSIVTKGPATKSDKLVLTVDIDSKTFEITVREK